MIAFGIRRDSTAGTILSFIIANEFLELFIVSSPCYQVLKEIIHLFHLNDYIAIEIILTAAKLSESI